MKEPIDSGFSGSSPLRVVWRRAEAARFSTCEAQGPSLLALDIQIRNDQEADLMKAPVTWTVAMVAALTAKDAASVDEYAPWSPQCHAVHQPNPLGATNHVWESV